MKIEESHLTADQSAKKAAEVMKVRLQKKVPCSRSLHQQTQKAWKEHLGHLKK